MQTLMGIWTLPDSPTFPANNCYTTKIFFVLCYFFKEVIFSSLSFSLAAETCIHLVREMSLESYFSIISPSMTSKIPHQSKTQKQEGLKIKKNKVSYTPLFGNAIWSMKKFSKKLNRFEIKNFHKLHLYNLI